RAPTRRPPGPADFLGRASRGPAARAADYLGSKHGGCGHVSTNLGHLRWRAACTTVLDLKVPSSHQAPPSNIPRRSDCTHAVDLNEKPGTQIEPFSLEPASRNAVLDGRARFQ